MIYGSYNYGVWRPIDINEVNQITFGSVKCYDCDEEKVIKTGKNLYLATFKPMKPTLRIISQFNLDYFDEIYTIDKFNQSISKEDMPIGTLIDFKKLVRQFVALFINILIFIFF